jgi:ADP-ribose pyrophosphatase YjhB (NUDIX family)
MTQPGLATDRNGVTLMEYTRIPESMFDPEKYLPLGAALIVTSYNNRFLLVFNCTRQCWEIPGGKIEPGESPLTAARRELKEESGQNAEPLKFEAVVRFSFSNEQPEMYGAVYSVVLNSLIPFKATPEISQIILWDKQKDIGYINEIDNALIELFTQNNTCAPNL